MKLIEFYSQQAETQLADMPWLAHLQQNALNDFAHLGFPSRHHEEWRYTSLDNWLKNRFVVNNAPAASPKPRNPLFNLEIAVLNGKVDEQSNFAALFSSLGIIVQPVMQALHENPLKIQPYLNQIFTPRHGFHALNTAFLQQGVFIFVPAGITLEEPLLLSHWQDNNNQATYLRHVIVAESNSTITVVEDYSGESNCNYLTNTMTEIHAAADATVTHYKIQREGHAAYHFGHLAARQEASSHLNSHLLNLGGRQARNEIFIDFAASGAHCLLNGIYTPSRDQQMDHLIVINHAVPNCQSEQNYKGILTDKARATFNGKVVVAKDAQHTQAKQQNKNVLLSAKAEINTRPQLEIYADDVICSHGATVGQLDEEAIFYLTTRGIGQKEAKRFLLEAFIAENVQQLGAKTIINWVSPMLHPERES